MPTPQDLFAPPSSLRRLQIEVTTFCNLMCEECSRTIAINKGEWIDKHMTLEEFKRLVRNSPPAEILVLQGVGEPSLNPELVEITRFARDTGRFKHITLNTNAVTRSMDYFRELKEAGLGYVCISVDSLNDEIANLCRYGTKTDKLKTRIREIYKEFGTLVISVVGSQLNYFDLPQTLFELNRIGEDIHPDRQFVVEVVPVIDYKDQTSNQPHNSLSSDETRRLSDILKLLAPKLPRLHAHVNAGVVTNNKQGQICGRPFVSPYITVDGFMTPCCTTFDPGHYQHTNLHFMSMDQAWRSPPVQEWLRSYHARGHPICEGCAFKLN